MCRGTISFANGAIEVEAPVIAEALDLPPEVLMTMSALARSRAFASAAWTLMKGVTD